MQKITLILSILALTLFYSCSEDSDAPQLEMNQPSWDDEIREEFGIDIEGLVLESAYNIDSTAVLVGGRIENKLWVGGYSKGDGECFMEFKENSLLDSIVTVHKGYGEYAEIEVEKRAVLSGYTTQDYTVFILGLDPIPTADLYFTKGNNLLRKCRFLDESGYVSPNEYYRGILTWYENTVLVSSYNYNTNAYTYTVFSLDGDSLLNISSKYHPYTETHKHLINNEEFIQTGISESLSSQSLQDRRFSRINAKTEETVWTTANCPLSEIDGSVKVTSLSIDKQNESWTYTIKYTQYDGASKQAEVKLNIATGDYQTVYS